MLYKWPQGKILRTVLVLLVLLIAADLGRSCYAQIVTYLEPEGQWAQAAIGGVLGLLSLVVLVGGVVAILVLPRSAQFVIEVEQEMARVTWPAQNEVWRSTIVIAVMTAVLALMVFLVDFVNKFVVLDSILGHGG